MENYCHNAYQLLTLRLSFNIYLCMNSIQYMWLVIKQPPAQNILINALLPHFYPPVPYRMTAHCSSTVLLNSIAVMSAQVLYMWCLSTADPNYLNVALILRIQGIVKLNQGQPEVNDGQNYLGGSEHPFQKPAFNVAAVTALIACRLNFRTLQISWMFFF